MYFPSKCHFQQFKNSVRIWTQRTKHFIFNFREKEYLCTYILIGHLPVGSLSIRHNFPHYNSVAPDITGRGEFSKSYCFWGSPSDWNFASLKLKAHAHVYIYSTYLYIYMYILYMYIFQHASRASRDTAASLRRSRKRCNIFKLICLTACSLFSHLPAHEHL